MLVTDSVDHRALLVVLGVHLKVVDNLLKIDIFAGIFTLLVNVNEVHMQQPVRGQVVEVAADLVLGQGVLLLDRLVAICQNRFQ